MGHLEALCPKTQWCPKSFPEKANTVPTTTKVSSPNGSDPMGSSPTTDHGLATTHVTHIAPVVVSGSGSRYVPINIYDMVSTSVESSPAIRTGFNTKAHAAAVSEISIGSLASIPSIGSELVMTTPSPSTPKGVSGIDVSSAIIVSPSYPFCISPPGILIRHDNMGPLATKEQITHVVSLPAHPSSKPKPFKITKKAASSHLPPIRNPLEFALSNIPSQVLFSTNQTLKLIPLSQPS